MRWLNVPLLAACVMTLRAQDAPPPAVAAAKGTLMPGDVLDNIGQQTKARWRQLYRVAPPATPSERLRVAFMVGALVADSYLAQQACDAQQFKNTNQDLINYCKALGLGEKVTPGFLGVAKSAERDDWPEVRKQVTESQALIEKQLHDQKDEDLATLVDLGMWMRLFEITTSIVVNDSEIKNKTLCIGSVPLLNDLKSRYAALSEGTRSSESVARLGSVLDMLYRHWENTDGHPADSVVQLTAEKLNVLMTKLTLQ